MIPIDSQEFESYLPVYDVVPQTWEEGKIFLVEQLRKHALAINIRTIGWYLDQELLTGKAFVPTANELSRGYTNQQFRSVLRKVIVFPGLTAGVNTQPHGIMIDANFTLVQLYGAATNATALTGQPIPNGSNTITYDATNIIITVSANYDRAQAVIEYMQEL